MAQILVLCCPPTDGMGTETFMASRGCPTNTCQLISDRWWPIPGIPTVQENDGPMFPVNYKGMLLALHTIYNGFNKMMYFCPCHPTCKTYINLFLLCRIRRSLARTGSCATLTDKSIVSIVQLVLSHSVII